MVIRNVFAAILANFSQDTTTEFQFEMCFYVRRKVNIKSYVREHYYLVALFLEVCQTH